MYGVWCLVARFRVLLADPLERLLVPGAGFGVSFFFWFWSAVGFPVLLAQPLVRLLVPSSRFGGLGFGDRTLGSGV